MRYSDDLVEEIRMKNDIVDVISGYVKLTRRGSSYFGLCPFHNEKSPSFSVSPGKQMYYCFGCGAGGNVFTFLMEYENFTFVEALKFLADRAGVELPQMEYSKEAKEQADLKNTLLEINKQAAKFYYYQLHTERGKQGYDYLKGRGLSDDTIRKFGLGYSDKYGSLLYRFLKEKGYDDEILRQSGLFLADEVHGMQDKFWNRVIYPIMDANSRVIGFGGRVMGDGKPKYLNSPETKIFDKSRNLYGLHLARSSRRKNLIICEGYMDVISMQQAGIDTAVCACGTALTPDQVRLISEYADEVILSYDSDEAGQKATLRSLELFRNSPVKVGVLQIPGAKDPDEYIKKYGAERFKALLDGVGNALDFRLGRLRSQYDLSQDAQRLEYVKQAVDLLAERSSPTEQEVYAGRLAEETNISKTAIMTQLETAVKRVGSKRRYEKKKAVLQSGEMNQIKVSYTAGGSQALGIVSAQQRLLAAILREPRYLDLVQGQLTADRFIQPQQKELYQAMVDCRQQGVDISLATLRAFVSEEALNELSHLAAQYSDVNCTPDDIRLYLDRIARGMPVASKAASMTNEELSSYFQSMREKE